jgi:predicted Zn finger-like uncharacterized protein
MHVTCPSCKFGGTVRDDQIPPDGKEVFCPSCNLKFRIKKNQSVPAADRRADRKAVPSDVAQSEYIPISCPICGFKGKLKRSTVATGQSRRFTCPSCKNPFTLALPDNGAPPTDNDVSDDIAGGAPSSCTGCGSRITHALPICPTCGKILTGVKIYCPSCKSTNVGISDETHNDGRPQGETIIFRPVSPTAAKQNGIHIPLLCRDCGKTWTIQTDRIRTSETSSELSRGDG